MKPVNKTYTKEDCQTEALKYRRRVDFQNESKLYYRSAIYHGWLEDICSHMGEPLTLKKRLIYVYEFDDNRAYVGLTCDEMGRHASHMRKGAVYKYIKKTGLTPKRKLLTDYIEVYEAKNMEDSIMNEYRDNGWILLNSYKAGGTGGVYKYTENRCREESKLYNDIKLFRKEKKGFYNAIKRNGWYVHLKHMDNKSQWLIDKLNVL
jgi:predicted GIY-YIG superfamily endonuclease